MKKYYVIITCLFLLCSCESREKQIIGHWHEYKIDNPEYILNCYHYTDSTVTETIFNNGFPDNKRGIDMPKDSIYSWSNEYLEYSSDYKIKNEILFFNDSIRWKKIKLDPTNFADEFSIGLFVNVHPPQLQHNNFELLKLPNRPIIYIYIGQIKPSLNKTFPKFDSKKFHMQFNDKIGSIDEIGHYANCFHCDMNELIFIIHADKDTPKQLIEAMEDEMANQHIRKNQIYYLYINENDMTFGYNKEFN